MLVVCFIKYKNDLNIMIYVMFLWIVIYVKKRKKEEDYWIKFINLELIFNFSLVVLLVKSLVYINMLLGFIFEGLFLKVYCVILFLLFFEIGKFWWVVEFFL